MNVSPIQLPPTMADRFSTLPRNADPVDTALSEFDRRIESLRLCVHWLVKNGVTVIDTALGRAGGIVTIAASPKLRTLLSDCCWRKRRKEGALAYYT